MWHCLGQALNLDFGRCVAKILEINRKIFIAYPMLVAQPWLVDDNDDVAALLSEQSGPV